MTVTTTTRSGKQHFTDCPDLFTALELVDGLLVLDVFVSIKIDEDEFIGDPQ